MEPVRVALDWTPNTSHAALLVAHAKGFFGDEGLAVSFVSPTDEGAPDTPCTRRGLALTRSGSISGLTEVFLSPPSFFSLPAASLVAFARKASASAAAPESFGHHSGPS